MTNHQYILKIGYLDKLLCFVVCIGCFETGIGKQDIEPCTPSFSKHVLLENLDKLSFVSVVNCAGDAQKDVLTAQGEFPTRA